ncbi:MAG: hypothetical protein IIB19_00550 [Chloroflexi bacterium]|nr:hypothetical protein [Chloroflexota bacterium]
MALDRQAAEAYLAEEVRHEAMDIDRNAAGIGRQKTIGDFTIPIPPKKDAPFGVPSTGEEVQVAGLGTVIRMMTKTRKVKTRQMLETQRANIAAPDRISETEADAMRAAMAEPEVPTDKLTEQRNINIERHHQGAKAGRFEFEPADMLEVVESDDIAKLLDYTASRMETLEKISFKEIREGTSTHAQILKEFEPILEGQTGLWTARQLFAARRILTTVGGQLRELAQRIKLGDTAPEVILRFEQKGAAFMAIHDGLRKNVRGVAQALASQRMIAETLDSGDIERIAAAMKREGGTTHDSHKRAALMLKAMEAGDPDDVMTMVNAVKGNKWRRGMDLAIQYWQMSILSGPTTHIVNLTGNTAVMLWEAAAVRPLAAAIGAVRTRLPGAKQDRVTGEEAIANLIAGWVGARDGVAAAAEVLAGKQGQFRGSRVDYRSPEELGELEKAGRWVGEKISGGKVGSKRHAIGGKVGEYAAALPFKALQAGDEIFKTIAYRQEIVSLVLRDAMRRNLKGDEFKVFVMAAINDPPPEFYDAAMKRAREMTFQERDLGGLAGALLNGARGIVEEYPMAKFLMPFITTPSNLLRYSMETSALAVISPRLWGQVRKGGAEADIALAKMSLGLLVTLAAFTAYEGGMITGNGPEDWNLRMVLLKTGWLPNAIRIGDNYYTYNRMDPFAASISAIADHLDKAKYAGRESTTEEAIMQITFGIAEHTLDATYMRSVNDMLKAIDGSEKQRNRFLANYAASFVPYSSALRSIKQHQEDYASAAYTDVYTQGLIHQIWQRSAQSTPDFVPLLPGSSDLPKRRYWDGSYVIPQPGHAMWNSSPIKFSTQKEVEPADAALIANGYGPARPASVMSLGGVEFSLLALDRGRGWIYDAFVEKVGKQRKEFVDELVASDAFKAMEAGPGSKQFYELRRVIGQATVLAREEFIEDDLKRLTMEDPDAMSMIAEMFGMDPASGRHAQGTRRGRLRTHRRAEKDFSRSSQV